MSRNDRSKAIAYLKDKYGEDKVCQISAFSKYKARSTIKSLLSAKRGFTSDFQNEITKAIPAITNGVDTTYEMIEYFGTRETEDFEVIDSLEDLYLESSEKDRSIMRNAYAVLQELFKTNPEVKDGLMKFRNVISGVSIHAGGVIISSEPIIDTMALMKGSKTAVLQVCQADMEDVTFYGMLKIDALGLKTLSQIDLCLEMANIDRSWLDNEDTTDQNVYKFLREGNTFNVFQMHKRTPTTMIHDFNVRNLEGLTAVNAGNRPGPLAKGEDGKSMVDTFAENAKSKEVEGLDPRIDHILESTNMCLWYQEHCIKLGMIMAGYSLGGADIRIRKILGKKLLKKIPEIRNEFVYGKQSIFDENGVVIGIAEEDSEFCIGAVKNGFDEDLAIRVFEIMKEFAKYAFNKSHSAAYALVAYRTAWLSYYYPHEWYSACLTVDSDAAGKDAIIDGITSAKRRGLKVIPPHINKSKQFFSVLEEEGVKYIVFGLSGVPRAGSKVVDAIMYMREKDGEFKDFKDFLDRIYVKNDSLREYVSSLGSGKFTNPFNKANIENIIKVGAFDSMEENRYKLLNTLMAYSSLTAAGKLKLASIDDLEIEDINQEDDFNLKTKLQMEYDTMGMYISQHPLDDESVFPYVDTNHCKNREKVTIAGIVKSFTKKKAKNGKPFYKLAMEAKDGGIVQVTVFDNVYYTSPQVFKGLQGAKVKEGKEIVIASGSWNPNFGLTCSSIKRVTEATKEEYPTPSEGIPTLISDLEQEDIFETVK